jgi:hypothetical protein
LTFVSIHLVPVLERAFLQRAQPAAEAGVEHGDVERRSRERALRRFGVADVELDRGSSRAARTGARAGGRCAARASVTRAP